MKVSFENLYHFNCDRCQGWWNVSDYEYVPGVTVWCHHCGHQHVLPQEVLTGDDFLSRKPELELLPGEVYQHRKHNPDEGKHHLYVLIGTVQPHPNKPGPDRSHFYFAQQYRHTDTEKLYTLVGCGSKIYADVEEDHVAYKNTQPDKCDEDWVFCLRPLREFIDGRFKLI